MVGCVYCRRFDKDNKQYYDVRVTYTLDGKFCSYRRQIDVKKITGIMLSSVIEVSTVIDTETMNNKPFLLQFIKSTHVVTWNFNLNKKNLNSNRYFLFFLYLHFILKQKENVVDFPSDFNRTEESYSTCRMVVQREGVYRSLRT